eukprot:Skav219154  [mRNA]  locus=scaffold1574:862685:863105:+ [translate_table: standard]
MSQDRQSFNENQFLYIDKYSLSWQQLPNTKNAQKNGPRDWAWTVVEIWAQWSKSTYRAQDPTMREPIVPTRLEVLVTSCFEAVLASDASALKGTDEWWRKMRTFPSLHFLYPNVYSTLVLLPSAALVK